MRHGEQVLTKGEDESHREQRNLGVSFAQESAISRPGHAWRLPHAISGGSAVCSEVWRPDTARFAFQGPDNAVVGAAARLCRSNLDRGRV